MKKVIQNLRKQPEDVRRSVLHIVMFLAIVFLAVLWFFTLGRHITDPNTKQQISDDINAFSSLKDNIVEGYQNVTGTGLSVEQ